MPKAKIHIQLTIILILQFCFFVSNAKEVSFERITSKDGLSQNDVLSTFKDSQGYT